MSLTSDEERIYVWAQKQQRQQITDSVFTGFDNLTESYFEKCCEEDSFAYEYAFETLAELKKQLLEMWGKNDYMQEIILISAVSAMKYKPEENRTAEVQFGNNEFDRELELPEYVYIF